MKPLCSIEKVTQALVVVFKEGCACIKDMPGDNYTCTAHELLYKIARGEMEIADGLN